MTHVRDGTKLAQHGLFYMENAGGYEPGLDDALLLPSFDEEHQPSCFALEEEKGEAWKGAGASEKVIKETKPSL